MPQDPYYVCDGCGDMTRCPAVPEGDEWTCEECGSHAAWEFTNGDDALAHSRHIQRVGKLFKARPRTAAMREP